MAEEKPDFQHPQSQSHSPQMANDQSVTILQNTIQELTRRVSALENRRINWNTDVIGLFQTVSVAPTQTPASPYQQVQIYVNSTTYRLYVYDNNAHVWHYATLT
jgi:hypothetical protein